MLEHDQLTGLWSLECVTSFTKLMSAVCLQFWMRQH